MVANLKLQLLHTISFGKKVWGGAICWFSTMVANLKLQLLHTTSFGKKIEEGHLPPLPPLDAFSSLSLYFSPILTKPHLLLCSCSQNSWQLLCPISIPKQYTHSLPLCFSSLVPANDFIINDYEISHQNLISSFNHHLHPSIHQFSNFPLHLLTIW